MKKKAIDNPDESRKSEEPENEDLWGHKSEPVDVHDLSEWVKVRIHPGKTFACHISALDDGLEQHELELTDDEARKLTMLLVDAYINRDFDNDDE